MERAIAAGHDRFRRANEELERRFGELGAEGAVPFICECAELTCTRVVSLTLDEYTEVRGTPGRLAVLPGHETPDLRVIEADERFLVVEQVGGASGPGA